MLGEAEEYSHEWTALVDEKIVAFLVLKHCQLTEYQLPVKYTHFFKMSAFFFLLLFFVWNGYFCFYMFQFA